MRVNPRISEEQNVLNHINEINEFPISLNDVEFGSPVVYVSLPEYVSPVDYKDSKFMLKNTTVRVSAKPTSTRWGKTATVKRYRRIHLGVQWYKYEVPEMLQNGRFIITTNTWKHDVPTVEEVYSAIGSHAEFRKESLVIEVAEYRQNRYNYDTGRLRVKPKPNSLIYIGAFELDVLFKPISFLADTLDGFVGIEDSGVVSGVGIIPRTLDGFVL